jgi:hypothetical protein
MQTRQRLCATEQSQGTGFRCVIRVLAELKSILRNENIVSGCTCSVKDAKCTAVMKNVCLNSGGASDKNYVHIQVVLHITVKKDVLSVAP